MKKCCLCGKKHNIPLKYIKQDGNRYFDCDGVLFANLDLMNKTLEARPIVNNFKNKAKKQNYDFTLTIFQIGNNEASNIYIKNKTRLCEEIGLPHMVVRFEGSETPEDIIKSARKHMERYPGKAMLQLPIPSHYDEHYMINKMIMSEEDADCLTDVRLGQFFQGCTDLTPCTARGIITLLKANNISCEGKHMVVVGRSNIVGKPVALLGLQENATVTVCHSKTPNLKEVTSQADILIVAIGKPYFITEEYVKPGAVVIDVGINRDENNRVCGDVDIYSVLNKVSYITPVPGGVGPLTVMQLVKNAIGETEND